MIFSKTLLQDLNLNQKKLVTFLQKNTKTILNLSINKVAILNHVSPSFVTKTLKKIGFYGWKDYRAFVMANMIIPNSNVGYLKYIQKNLYPSIDSTISNIDELEINDLATKITKCKGIVFFIGEGFSYFIAKDQSRRYRKSGIKALAINSTDYEYQTINKDDIIILLSSSGYTKSIQITIKFLENMKIKYFLITMNPLIKTSIKNSICGSLWDTESKSEREFPRYSRFILLIILDWIFSKFKKLVDKQDDENQL